jgi:UDPglucose--hexose-1-phosphate uridylyltransferase
MNLSILSDFPHRRLNPLTGEWILVSPHRTRRPWKGQEEAPLPEDRPSYDPQCYLCPRNRRANGEMNPDYQDTFVFPNDFSAMLPELPGDLRESGHPLTQARPVRGECHVICFSPRHDLSLPGMPEAGIERVIAVWQDLIRTLGAKYQWVQIFENKGAAMGCSNAHPHGQVWAGDALPNEPAKEDEHQRVYNAGHGRILLLDYRDLESADGSRMVLENDAWIAVVPFWATWPFETLLLPKRHVLRLPDLDKDETHTLSVLLKQLLCKYDNLFNTSFPYTMGWHGAPTGPGEYGHWQLHAHVYPPLLRSATVKKFMVGYEMLSEPQRDITPEQAADRLKTLPASPKARS